MGKHLDLRVSIGFLSFLIYVTLEKSCCVHGVVIDG